MSRKEANALLEIVDAGLRSKSEEDFRKLVLRLQDLVPFEFALCSLASISYRSADPYRMINVSYPLSWLDRYISEQLDMVDPVVVEHRLHFGLQYWSDSYEKHPEARQFIMSASDYGLKTGYSYGLKTESGSGASLFSFGGRSMERSRPHFPYPPAHRAPSPSGPRARRRSARSPSGKQRMRSSLREKRKCCSG